MRWKAYASRPDCRLQTLLPPPDLTTSSRASYYLYNSLRLPPELPATFRASCLLPPSLRPSSEPLTALEVAKGCCGGSRRLRKQLVRSFGGGRELWRRSRAVEEVRDSGEGRSIPCQGCYLDFQYCGSHPEALPLLRRLSGDIPIP